MFFPPGPETKRNASLIGVHNEMTALPSTTTSCSVRLAERQKFLLDKQKELVDLKRQLEQQGQPTTSAETIAIQEQITQAQNDAKRVRADATAKAGEIVTLGRQIDAAGVPGSGALISELGAAERDLRRLTLSLRTVQRKQKTLEAVKAQEEVRLATCKSGLASGLFS